METWDRADGSRGERSPRTNLANVPPEVLRVGITHMNVELAYQSWSRIRRCEI
jgi:hypothetical protein